MRLHWLRNDDDEEKRGKYARTSSGSIAFTTLTLSLPIGQKRDKDFGVDEGKGRHYL